MTDPETEAAYALVLGGTGPDEDDDEGGSGVGSYGGPAACMSRKSSSRPIVYRGRTTGMGGSFSNRTFSSSTAAWPVDHMQPVYMQPQPGTESFYNAGVPASQQPGEIQTVAPGYQFGHTNSATAYDGGAYTTGGDSYGRGDVPHATRSSNMAFRPIVVRLTTPSGYTSDPNNSADEDYSLVSMCPVEQLDSHGGQSKDSRNVANHDRSMWSCCGPPAKDAACCIRQLFCVYACLWCFCGWACCCPKGCSPGANKHKYGVMHTEPGAVVLNYDYEREAALQMIHDAEQKGLKPSDLPILEVGLAFECNPQSKKRMSCFDRLVKKVTAWKMGTMNHVEFVFYLKDTDSPTGVGIYSFNVTESRGVQFTKVQTDKTYDLDTWEFLNLPLTAMQRVHLWVFCVLQMGKDFDEVAAWWNFIPVIRSIRSALCITRPEPTRYQLASDKSSYERLIPDKKYIRNPNKSWFCSEFVATALASVDPVRFSAIDPATAEPGHIYKLCKMVYETTCWRTPKIITPEALADKLDGGL